MYRRYILVATVVVCSAFPVACAEPEAEKAIFVARETTTTSAQELDEQADVSTTSEGLRADQNTDEHSDVAPTT